MNDANETKEVIKSNQKRHQMDMCSGSILGKMLLFALPLMGSNMLQLFFNAMDIAVIGNFRGEDSMAAVGSNTALVNLLTNLFIGLSVGANVLSAQYFGAKKKEALSKTIHTAMLLSIISGAVLTIVGLIFADQLLLLMKTPIEVLPLATTYLRIYFLGMVPMMIYNFGSAILRSIGDTKRPMIYLSTGGLINALLNLFFVIVCGMDVEGVAIATIISQFISGGLILRCLMKDPDDSIRLELKKMRIDGDSFLKILRIGIPAGLQGIVFSLSNVVIQSSVNSFGKVIMAGNSAAMNIEGFVYVAMNAFHHATLSFTGQNMGASEYKRVKKIAITGQICVFCTGVILGMIMIFFGKYLMLIYSRKPEVIQAGITRMYVIGATYFLCGMMDVMVGSLRGLGYSVLPTIVSLLGACALRLVWLATVFIMPAYHSITTVYVSYPISWSITFVAQMTIFLIVYNTKIRRLQRRKEERNKQILMNEQTHW